MVGDDYQWPSPRSFYRRCPACGIDNCVGRATDDRPGFCPFSRTTLTESTGLGLPGHVRSRCQMSALFSKFDEHFGGFFFVQATHSIRNDLDTFAGFQ